MEKVRPCGKEELCVFQKNELPGTFIFFIIFIIVFSSGKRNCTFGDGNYI